MYFKEKIARQSALLCEEISAYWLALRLSQLPRTYYNTAIDLVVSSSYHYGYREKLGEQVAAALTHMGLRITMTSSGYPHPYKAPGGREFALCIAVRDGLRLWVLFHAFAHRSESCDGVLILFDSLNPPKVPPVTNISALRGIPPLCKVLVTS